MPVDTKTVPGRRELTFSSLGEVVADAEKLVASPSPKMLGNWPLSQLLTHLATAIKGSIDGYSTKAPWFIRLIGPLMKGRFLRNKMSPGFKLPKDVEVGFFPATASPQEALEELRAVVDRTQNERMTARHPILGKMTHEDWTRLHLRHAELHLSFAVPG
jgi:hypothetical protein